MPDRALHGFIEVTYDQTRGNLELLDHGGFESRNQSCTRLIMSALNRLNQQFGESFHFAVYTGDRSPPEPMAGIVNLSCAVDRNDLNAVAAPDFMFDRYLETGISDYEEIRVRILRSGVNPPADSRVLWIGNAATSPIRQRLVELSTQHPSLLLAISMSWRQQMGKVALLPLGNYISLPEHCRHQYLIDVEGNGYSSRLKLLLLSGRPVFVQERRFVEYWHKWLYPYVHYIPIAHDLTDLIERIEWARENRDLCEQIALNGQQFAIKCLSREAALSYLGDVLRVIIASDSCDNDKCNTSVGIGGTG